MNAWIHSVSPNEVRVRLVTINLPQHDGNSCELPPNKADDELFLELLNLALAGAVLLKNFKAANSKVKWHSQIIL